MDDSHTENIDWGHYPETNGNKLSCQSQCFKDDNCETYEWSNTDGKEMCKWWNKGMCQYRNGKKSDDPKFVSCKKAGNILTNQSIVLCNNIFDFFYEMLLTIAHSVHLEYDFKEHDNNTVCIPRGADEFTDLQEAKRECKKKRYCKGVLHPGCMDQTKYYLCNVTAKLVTNTIDPSYFYQKHVIGKNKACQFHFKST